MSDNLEDMVSALKVQRDSALKQKEKVETANWVLLRHQAEIRQWLADAIAKWEAALNNDDDPYPTAHQIHQQAIKLLREAESHL